MHRRTISEDYVSHAPMTATQVLEKAAEIINARYSRGTAFNSAETAKDYLGWKLGGHEREVFSVVLLDSQHRLIEYKELFYGTIDAAPVYPREIVKLVLEVNAAACILAHNHPSGCPEPSSADKNITERVKNVLAMIDVKVLDHIIVGDRAISFSERGLI